jgi:hypothetical protein
VRRQRVFICRERFLAFTYYMHAAWQLFARRTAITRRRSSGANVQPL